MDVAIKTQSLSAPDNDFIASYDGTDVARSLKIDLSTAVPATHYPQGWLPKGTILAQRTADKMYALYNDAGTGGLEVAKVVLLAPIQVSAPGGSNAGKVYGAGLWRGVLKLGSQPFTSGLGAFDAAAQADLAGKFFYIS